MKSYKNKGFKSLLFILNILNGVNMDEEFHFNLSLGKFIKFKYTPLISCDVEQF